jgi:hypothetical protein
MTNCGTCDSEQYCPTHRPAPGSALSPMFRVVADDPYPVGRPARITDGGSLLRGYVSASHDRGGRAVLVVVTVVMPSGPVELSGVVDHVGRGMIADKYPVLVDGPHPHIPPEVTVDVAGNQIIESGYADRLYDHWVACAGHCGYLVGARTCARPVWHDSCRQLAVTDSPVVRVDAVAVSPVQPVHSGQRRSEQQAGDQ